jgi:hypothetical protein
MKRPVISLVTVLAATLYGIFVVSSLASAFNETTAGGGDAEALGAAIGVGLLLPHVLLTWLGILLNWVGYGAKIPGMTLAAAILYSVAAFLGFLYIVFMVPIIVLAYISFAQERKRKKAA